MTPTTRPPWSRRSPTPSRRLWPTSTARAPKSSRPDWPRPRPAWPVERAPVERTRGHLAPEPVPRRVLTVIEYQERLRSLALSDDHFVGSVLGMSQDTVEVSRLDSKTHALVRLAALLAVDAGQSS